jgi:uncharacterized protein (TIGR04222 family)
MEQIEIACWSARETALWQRLCAHSFEHPDQGLDFTRRLAREQGWTHAEARAAIAEYRRFCFLACVGDNHATPSAEVDEVWHLHLIHTRDYWSKFCPEVLQTTLHHGPTRGGSDERQRYRRQYADTLARYEQWFGPPPERWWPDTRERFAEPAQVVRIDARRHWIIAKPAFATRIAGGAGLLLSVLAAREAAALPANPLDWTAGPFLQLYLALMLVGLVVAIWLRRMARDSGSARGERPGAYDLAYLAGGAPRCVDAVVAQMLGDGSLRWDETRKTLKLEVPAASLDPPLDAVARCVAADGKPDQVLRRAGVALAPLRKSLQARALWLDDAAAWRARLHSAAPLLLVAALGSAKMVVGASRGKPIGFLVVLTMILGLVALGFLLVRPTRTRAGDQAIADAKQRNARALRAPRNSELGLAVALLGTAALSGTAWAGYHQVRAPPSSSSDGGGSDSSSDGGGGGGGCGGCGGGGD